MPPRTTESAFYNMGFRDYWWYPSPYDSVHSYASGLRPAPRQRQLQICLGLKNYGMPVRGLIDDQETTVCENMETSKRQEAMTAIFPGFYEI